MVAGSVVIVDVNAGVVLGSILLAATVVLTITCGLKLPDWTLGTCMVVLTKSVGVSSSLEEPSITELEGMLVEVP